MWALVAWHILLISKLLLHSIVQMTYIQTRMDIHFRPDSPGVWFTSFYIECLSVLSNTCIYILYYSCFEPPGGWKDDGPDRWQVASEQSLWLWPSAVAMPIMPLFLSSILSLHYAHSVYHVYSNYSARKKDLALQLEQKDVLQLQLAPQLGWRYIAN